MSWGEISVATFTPRNRPICAWLALGATSSATPKATIASQSNRDGKLVVCCMFHRFILHGFVQHGGFDPGCGGSPILSVTRRSAAAAEESGVQRTFPSEHDACRFRRSLARLRTIGRNARTLERSSRRISQCSPAIHGSFASEATKSSEKRFPPVHWEVARCAKCITGKSVGIRKTGDSLRPRKWRQRRDA